MIRIKSLQLKSIKHWYLQRHTRERVLILGLCWAISYFIFNVLFLIPQEKKRLAILADTQIAQHKLNSWQTQTNAIDRIISSKSFQQWKKQKAAFHLRSIAYKSLLRSSSEMNWDSVIKSMLFSNNQAVKIERIHNSPETPFNPPDIAYTHPNVYEQKLELVINSNYFDTIEYLKQLRAALPTIHWDNLSYHVNAYPFAITTIGFSILYEKNS